MKIIYIAGRFRGATAWDVAQNIRAAEHRGFEVAQLGAMPLIPHANTAQFDGTLTGEFWLEGTMELLRQRVLAARYGVHQVTISRIKRGLRWAP